MSVKKIGKAILWWFTWPIKLVKKAYGKLKGFIKGIGSDVGGFFKDVGGGIKDTIGGAVDFVTGSLQKFGGEDFIKEMERIKVEAEKGAKGMEKPLVGAIKNVKKELGGTEKKGQSVMGNLAGFAIGAAKDTLDFVEKYAKETEKKLKATADRGRDILAGGQKTTLASLALATQTYHEMTRFRRDRFNDEQRKVALKNMMDLQNQAHKKYKGQTYQQLDFYKKSLLDHSLFEKDRVKISATGAKNADKVHDLIRKIRDQSIEDGASFHKREAAVWATGDNAARAAFAKSTKETRKAQFLMWAFAKSYAISGTKGMDDALKGSTYWNLPKQEKHL